MGTKKDNSPRFEAIPDNEPVFILRAQDKLASNCVEFWAGQAYALGLKNESKDARKIAHHMEVWPNRKLPSAKRVAPTCKTCPNWRTNLPETITPGFGFCAFHETHTCNVGTCKMHPNYDIGLVIGVCRNSKGEELCKISMVHYQRFIRWSTCLLKLNGSFHVEMYLVHEVSRKVGIYADEQND